MKVRIGGVQHQWSPGASKAVEITNQIAGSLASVVINNAYELTPRFLRRLKLRLQAAATAEANRIFGVILAAMDQTRSSTSGLSYSDVMSGTSLAPGINAPGGRIIWPELSYAYAIRKGRTRPQNKNRFFQNSGQLRNYFTRQGASIVRSRLGGVQVTVDESPAHSAASRRYDGRTVWRRAILPEEVSNLLLGRVEVSMFPRLTPALAPMLSTRRWTDAGSGAMERQMFSGTRAVNKLVNRNRPYRPLVAPTVQFFMLVRIPSAIKRALSTYLSKAAIRAD